MRRWQVVVVAADACVRTTRASNGSLEIAKDLKVNINTVRRWIQSGELVALDIGGEYRISREDYEEFVQRRKTDKRKQ